MFVVVIELCVGYGETSTTQRGVDRCGAILVVRMCAVHGVRGHGQIIVITLINGHA